MNLLAGSGGCSSGLPFTLLERLVFPFGVKNENSLVWVDGVRADVDFGWCNMDTVHVHGSAMGGFLIFFVAVTCDNRVA